MIDWTLRQLAAAMGGALVAGDPEMRIKGVAVDSRLTTERNLFFALPGERVDGNQFVDQAAERGACAAVSARPERPNRLSEMGWIRVRDPLEALQALTRARRETLNTQVVAVTGSNGKTTTRSMIATALRGSYHVSESPRNYNGQIGVPLTILGADASAQVLVAEAGISMPGEMERLAAMLQPHVAVELNVGPVHLEFFPDVEAIAREKEKLLPALPMTGTAILNSDDPLCRAMAAATEARVVFFGRSGGDVIWDSTPATSAGQQMVTISGIGAEVAYRLPIPGGHMASNSCAALAVAQVLDVPLELAARRLESFSPGEMRFEIRTVDPGITIIEDCYNSSPLSCAAALDALSEMQTAGRKLAVLGDMFELGPAAPSFHRRLGRRAGEVVEGLIVVGEQADAVAAGAIEGGLDSASVLRPEDNSSAVDALRALAVPGDLVLIKASRGMHFEEIVAGIESFGARDEAG